MKKFLIAAAFLLLAGNVYAGRVLKTPAGYPQALPTADYGGISVATVTYSSANVLLFGNEGGSIVYVHTDSAPADGTAFFIIRSTSPDKNTGLPPVYLSTQVAISGGNAGLGDYSTNNEVYRVHVATVQSNGLTFGLGSGNALAGWDYVFPKPLRVPGGATFKMNTPNWGPTIIGYTKFE